MKGRIFTVMAVLALIFCLSGVALAVTSIGEPQPADSWSQEWNESGVGNFNALEFFMISPASIDLEAPGFRGFTTLGWTVGDPNPKYTFATNTGGITSTNWTSYFTGSATAGTTFDFFAWTNGILNGAPAEYAHAVWNGGWTITAAGVQNTSGVGYNRSPVPIPPTALLLGSGLLGIGLLRFRRKTAN